jgi:cephalosporin-C deacetylase
MPFVDLPLDQLRQYRSDRPEPADFDDFWQQTLQESREYPLEPTFQAVDCGLKTVETYNVTFHGYRGQPIKAWFIQPVGNTRPLPGVIQFIGYGGGRGHPIDWLPFPSAGYAYMVMDTRGQGSGWLRGDTPDPDPSSNPYFPGVMTQGILNPQNYYYRRLFTDAVRAVETLRSHPSVDPQRIAVTGISQGGGISIAVSGLMPEIAVCMPNVPFLCHYRRGTELASTGPYPEIVKYLSVHHDQLERVFNTLDYFDAVNFARRTQAKCLYSTALMDTSCPPSTVFAAYNQVIADKEIRVYPYNGHEGGSSDQLLENLRYLQDAWPA